MGSSPQVRGTPLVDSSHRCRSGLIPAGAGNTSSTRSPARRSRAHPRRCGEHPHEVLRSVCHPGSSPQVRGTRGHRPRPRPPSRLIPAGAGNTSVPRIAAPPVEAHPRRCGEHETETWEATLDQGSSPQVRGTHGDPVCGHQNGGLIPAGAGNTTNSCGRRASSRAHPRRCGEHRAIGQHQRVYEGSSPQVRGTRVPRDVVGDLAGLIPAGAGNTSCPAPTGRPTGAHPRRCGEHPPGHRGHGRHVGSSPQVRGTRPGAEHRVVGVGLIPAGAGNTGQLGSPAWPSRAHPRRCGEHRWGAHLGLSGDGSSPQVRGTRPRSWRPPQLLGLIPAGAGNTRIRIDDPEIVRAHPRRCGEHVHAAEITNDDSGSSPQVRGTPQALDVGAGVEGLIPAGAGNTPTATSSRTTRRAHPRRCGEHVRVPAVFRA